MEEKPNDSRIERLERKVAALNSNDTSKPWSQTRGSEAWVMGIGAALMPLLGQLSDTLGRPLDFRELLLIAGLIALYGAYRTAVKVATIVSGGEG